MIEFRTLGPLDLGPDPTGELAALLAQPKRLALLAYLAAAAPHTAETNGKPHFVRRDTLSALFWPEHDQEHARSSLRQALRGLRQPLGPNVILTQGYEAVALDARAIWCDAVAFQSHLAAGDHAAGVALYRGEFLTGFFLTDAPEFERWMEDRRARLRRAACAAARALSESYVAAGQLADATTMARHAAGWCSDDEGVVRSLIALLDRAGDRAGAMQAYDAFARRLKDDYDCEPAAETRALIAAVRARLTAHVIADARLEGRTPRPAVKAQRALPERLTIGEADAPEPRGVAARPAPLPHAGDSRLTDATDGPQRAHRVPKSRRRLFVAGALAVLGALGLLARAVRPSAETLGAAVAATHDPMPNVTIRFPDARALFEAGVNRLYANQPEEAAKLLIDALSRDSSCAMCAYYAFRAKYEGDGMQAQHLLDIAERQSNRVSPRERLLIHYAYADQENDPARLAIAESLFAAYHEAPESELSLGQALMMAGKTEEAIPHLEQAIALDAANRRAHGTTPLCWACDAEHTLVEAFFASDSVGGAMRAARDWTIAEPRNADAWNMLAIALARAARYDEASSAIDSGARYESKFDEILARTNIDLETDRYGSADSLLALLISTGPDASRRTALWLQVISFRAQGRRREALELAQGSMRWVEHAFDVADPPTFSPIAEAQALFEIGRFHESAQVFRTLAQRPDGVTRERPHLMARQNAWWLTHVADALAAAGDTSSLGALADSIEMWGRSSGFMRDQWLHFYVRALLWKARSRPDSSIAMLRRAPVTLLAGYPRAALVMAQYELELHNPTAAVRALQPAMRMGVQGGSYYATRTELHEALAQAFDAAGEADSASAHYRVVVSAWRRADPGLLPRVKRARARLAYLERSATKS